MPSDFIEAEEPSFKKSQHPFLDHHELLKKGTTQSFGHGGRPTTGTDGCSLGAQGKAASILLETNRKVRPSKFSNVYKSTII